MKIELTEEEVEWLLRVCDRSIKFMDMGFQQYSALMDDRKKIECLMMKLKMTATG